MAIIQPVDKPWNFTDPSETWRNSHPMEGCWAHRLFITNIAHRRNGFEHGLYQMLVEMHPTLFRIEPTSIDAYGDPIDMAAIYFQPMSESARRLSHQLYLEETRQLEETMWLPPS